MLGDFVYTEVKTNDEQSVHPSIESSKVFVKNHPRVMEEVKWKISFTRIIGRVVFVR